ncbi:MAG: exonuclease domain-containing protein [Candidatus Omnitrophota bacterium]
MAKRINETEFVIFDVETTGLGPESGDRIVEIAARRLKGKQRLGTFNSLVNLEGGEISPAAFAVNQITPEMLKGAPPIDQVLPGFLDFISGSCLAAYNAPFDIGFLCSELKLIKRELPARFEVIDILTMAKQLLSHLGRHALWFVAESLEINNIQQHRALSDVDLTVEVFHQLNSILTKKGITDFEQLFGLFGLNSQLLDDINSTKIARIQQALDSRVTLKIRYLSRHNAKVTEREIIPQAVIKGKQQVYPALPAAKQNIKGDISQGVYLRGFCNLRREERMFRIENILNLEMGAPFKTRPGKDSPAAGIA